MGQVVGMLEAEYVVMRIKKKIIMGALFRILGLHFWRTLHFVLYNMNYPFLVSFVVASLESRIGSIP